MVGESKRVFRIFAFKLTQEGYRQPDSITIWELLNVIAL
jgi:hypothetical protein